MAANIKSRLRSAISDLRDDIRVLSTRVSKVEERLCAQETYNQIISARMTDSHITSTGCEIFTGR